MAINTTFTDFVTPVPADWLNNVNTFVNTSPTPTQLTAAYNFTNQFSHKNLVDYGGVGDGTTDNTAALNAAIAACPTGQVVVYFPPGNFHFASTFNYTFPAGATTVASIRFQGAGVDLTNLSFGNTSNFSLGFALNSPYNSVHLEDFTLFATQAGGSNYRGIFISQNLSPIGNPANTAPSDITRVNIRGSDGYIGPAGFYFNDAIYINNASNINFTQVQISGYPTFLGNGVTLAGTSSDIPVAFNFYGCTFNACAIGINYGAWTQGVSVVACNFTGNNYGIASIGGLVGLDQLCVTGCQFNNYIAGISFASPLGACTITNNFFLVQNNGAGISMQNTADTCIFGNTFNPAVIPRTNQTCIIIGAWQSAATVITGNSFLNATIAVDLLAGSEFVNVQSNVYSSNTTNVLNNGTNNTIGGGSQ